MLTHSILKRNNKMARKILMNLLFFLGWFLDDTSAESDIQNQNQCFSKNNLFMDYNREQRTIFGFNEFLELEKASLISQNAWVIYPNGDEYRGPLSTNGEQIGFGIYHFADGRKYDGSFVNGFMEGWGRLQYPNKMIETEESIEKNTNVMTWEGEMKQGEPHGQGIWLFSNGDKCEGRTVKGQIHGKSLYFFKKTNQAIDVIWKMGQPLIPSGFTVANLSGTKVKISSTTGPIFSIPDQLLSQSDYHITNNGKTLLCLVTVIVIAVVLVISGGAYYFDQVLSPKINKLSLNCFRWMTEELFLPMNVAKYNKNCFRMTKKKPIKNGRGGGGGGGSDLRAIRGVVRNVGAWSPKTNLSNVSPPGNVPSSSNKTTSSSSWDDIGDICRPQQEYKNEIKTEKNPNNNHSLSLKGLVSYCGNCEQLLDQGSLKKEGVFCGSCQQPYCSKACQQQHWLNCHKEECPNSPNNSRNKCASTNCCRAHEQSMTTTKIHSTVAALSMQSRQNHPPNNAKLQKFDFSIPLPPYHLRCPITGELLSDPVLAADGETYEKEAIKRWVNEKAEEMHTASEILALNPFDLGARNIVDRGIQSPLGFGAFTHTSLTPNRAVKRLCEEWRENSLGHQE